MTIRCTLLALFVCAACLPLPADVSPALMAAYRGDLGSLRDLLQGDPALLQSRDETGYTLLHGAALGGRADVVAWLLERGAALDARSQVGETPLHLAASVGAGAVVKLLIRKGAAPNAATLFGETALHYAAANGSPECVAALLAGGADTAARNIEGQTPFLHAAASGSIAVLEELRKQAADIAAADKAGRNALHAAAWAGRGQAVAWLLARGLPVNRPDNGGDTPLHGAAYNGHVRVVRRLLAAGAAARPVNGSGDTALALALRRRHPLTAGLLGGCGTPRRGGSPVPPANPAAKARELDSLTLHILADNNGCRPGVSPDPGFACLVEGTEKPILFDSGALPAHLQENTAAMGIGLERLGAAVISHDHGDHIGGLEAALNRAPGLPVYLPDSVSFASLRRIAQWHGRGITAASPGPLLPGAWLSGETGGGQEEQALVLVTPRGLVVLTGCAHPGIVEIVTAAKKRFRRDVLLVAGGLHLQRLPTAASEQVCAALVRLGVQYCAAGHCTGQTALAQLKREFGPRFIDLGAGRRITVAAGGVRAE